MHDAKVRNAGEGCAVAALIEHHEGAGLPRAAGYVLGQEIAAAAIVLNVGDDTGTRDGGSGHGYLITSDSGRHDNVADQSLTELAGGRGHVRLDVNPDDVAHTHRN